ncbi:MAG TPA: tetratricopeptide repeat protein [Verrucomicrobiae bacterium]|nr:tetratricopeptide repeat protein [Verrucomicrobiae bacterium]
MSVRQRAPAKNNRSWIFLLLFAALLAGVAIFLSLRASFFKQLPGNNSAAPDNEKQIYAAYGGSASCRECHVEEYDAWAKSHHALAERLPNSKLDDAAFVPASTLHHGTQQTSFRKTGEQFEIVAPGLSSAREIFLVERVIGESPLRQMLVPFSGGRWQATETAYDPRSNQWFDVFGAEDRKPGEWGHWTGRGMNWNSACATCHNTRLRKDYDVTNDVYHTAMAERGVGCESCHGPMRTHNDWQHAHKNSGAKDPTFQKTSRDQMFAACAACHSRRTEMTGDPKPGESFFDHHLLSITDDSDTFYPDGQVRDEDYEVTAFLGSKMYQHGVRCADCHDFHTAKVRLPGNMMCLSCHAVGQTNAPAINPVTHSHHKVFGFDTNGVMPAMNLAAYKPNEIKETGGECVNCHMPQTVYMQRHLRHDHGFTIPDPLLTKQFGIPNACNRCHQDKDADWSLKHVEDWYGEKMNRPTRARAQTIARARNGDDSARDDLVKILKTDPQDYWRAVAARLLERWVDETPVAGALAEKLSDTNALVRQSAIQSLSALGESMSPDTRAELSRHLEDPSRNVRVAAALFLEPSLDLHSRAGQDLLQMLGQNADQPAGQMQLGTFALARGEATNALKHFQTAERWDSFSPEIRQELAVIFSQLGRPEDAVKELQEAVKLGPNEAEFHFKLALAWNELGDSAKALAELEEAVKLNPRHARAQYNLGLALNAAGNPSGAIQALLAAEAADPRDPGIPYARATIHAHLGQYDDARRAARRALEINPQFTDAERLLSQLQSK